VVTLLTSWLSTAVTLTTYYYTIRRSHPDTYDVPIKSVPVYCLWRLCELGPRFILLSLSVVYLPVWIYVGVGVHFVLAFVMHSVINPQLEGVCLSWMKIPFFGLVSFINIFCFINLEKGQTRKRLITFYILYYIENFVIMGLILHLLPNGHCLTSHSWHCASYALLPGAVLHLIFYVIYYGACHPNLKSVKCSLKRCCLE